MQAMYMLACVCILVFSRSRSPLLSLPLALRLPPPPPPLPLSLTRTHAQCHYPFENKAAFEASFPGDFIAEGLDQTRGWCCITYI